MYDADAIEAINIDQLATATDRLLLRRGCLRSSRPTIDMTRYAHETLAASRARAGKTARSGRRNIIAAFVAVASAGVTFACLLA
jgi:hypothetical protein